MQIRQIDAIEIDEADLPDAGRREIGRDRTAEAAGADDENAAFAEPLLPLDADLGKGDLAGVASQGSRRETISWTFLPSTRPLYFAVASFITLPMSFFD